jgi:hypothetical protein
MLKEIPGRPDQQILSDKPIKQNVNLIPRSQFRRQREVQKLSETH